MRGDDVKFLSEVLAMLCTNTKPAALKEKSGGDDTKLALATTVVAGSEGTAVDDSSGPGQQALKLNVSEVLTLVEMFECSLQSSDCTLSSAIAPLGLSCTLDKLHPVGDEVSSDVLPLELGLVSFLNFLGMRAGCNKL